MRTDVLELERFYGTRLGAAAAGFIAARISDAWGLCRGDLVAGHGYAEAVLDRMPLEARRLVHLAPAGRGVSAQRREGECLVEDHRWPIASESLDKLLILHGLEETAGPRRLMREAWRVLKDDGSIILAVANRSGPWSIFETSPFSAGRPYTRGQIEKLLSETMFRPTAWSRALCFPPAPAKALVRSAAAWERAGEKLWPGLAGVLLVEAQKAAFAPIAAGRAASPIRAVAGVVSGGAGAPRRGRLTPLRTPSEPQPLAA
ncbi:MAG: methyltransferase domain-containing protein [Pseudomonadota bacterium]